MKTLKQTYKIKAPVEKVWQALVDPKRIEEWGGGPVKMNNKKGGAFELWGGDIFGKNTEVKENKILEQEWQERGWKKTSTVTFMLKPAGKQTIITLIHRGVPDERVLDIEDGWKDYYLGEIKQYFENKNKTI